MVSGRRMRESVQHLHQQEMRRPLSPLMKILNFKEAYTTSFSTLLRCTDYMYGITKILCTFHTSLLRKFFVVFQFQSSKQENLFYIHRTVRARMKILKTKMSDEFFDLLNRRTVFRDRLTILRAYLWLESICNFSHA